MNAAIRVESLSKRYVIRHAQREPYVALRDVLARGAQSMWNRLRAPIRSGVTLGPAQEEFWALRDLSFEIGQGERVGIIGRNGAGKSTLLKVLSRITEPTSGRVSLRGRVASLLEVGTGFHPELTGRENIYLNGAILGMSRSEIRRKFDEIVDFAEVERFLDTPVKRYSSGMYVRLAFAVAAHLEPEVLIVDEVLAVGDAQFQKKCLGKMEEVGTEGRTVLFVSHNMGAIRQLCSRAILLSRGRCVLDTDVSTAVAAYFNSTELSNSSAVFERDALKESQITAMSIVSTNGEPVGTCTHREGFDVVIDYEVSNWHVGSYLCLDIFTEYDLRLLWSCDTPTVDDLAHRRAPGTYQARVRVPGLVLAPGRYYFTAAIFAPGPMLVHDAKERAISMEITDGGSLLSNFGIRPHAATMLPLSWQTESVQDDLLTEVGARARSTDDQKTPFI